MTKRADKWLMINRMVRRFSVTLSSYRVCARDVIKFSNAKLKSH